MDKVAQELLNLLREMLASQSRLLEIAVARQEAMRAYDLERMNFLLEAERFEAGRGQALEQARRGLVEKMRLMMGRGVEPTVSEVAKRVNEPVRSQLLGLSAQLKGVVGQLERSTRINAKVSETIVKGLAKVLKLVTGMAQHAGLYMRNGRKAALKGIHLLEVTA